MAIGTSMIRQTIMLKICAQALRSKLAFFTLVFISILGGLAYGQDQIAPSQLYLLSGTPTNYGDTTYPSRLYRIDPHRKLQLIREIVPASAGVYSVHGDETSIFIAYPLIIPTTVAIIHVGDPLREDSVIFNPIGLDPLQSYEAMAEPQKESLNELFPLLTADANAQLVSISSGTTAKQSRVKIDDWNQYAALRFDGAHGGPVLDTAPFGRPVGGKTVISIFGHDIRVESPPVSLWQPKDGAILWFMVVNRHYSVVAPTGIPKSAGSQDILVHDQKQGQWRGIRIEGDRSRLRIFGSWLAINVGLENPEHKAGPGRENERSQATDQFPNVQDLYSTFVGHDSFLPGILVLENLADHRRVRVEVGQEDSEILWADNGAVIYRVNDIIYQARITGNKVQDPIALARDDDVPQVHWVFWSH